MIFFRPVHASDQETYIGSSSRLKADGSSLETKGIGLMRGASVVGRLLVELLLASIAVGGVRAWSKEGHILTCKIAQELMEEKAEEAMIRLLPEHVDGELWAMCAWPDQIRIFHKYRWSSPLHYISIPDDDDCTFNYQRDCVDQWGNEDMCVAGAILNFTSQLHHHNQPSSLHNYNLTEALVFLSHFLGDIHQPLHVGFESDEGGNTIDLRWFKRKSNLHHVWDRDMIQTAMKNYYNDDLDLLLHDMQTNFTDGIWANDIPSWLDCETLDDCVNEYAKESIEMACEWSYQGVTSGDTLSDEYFNSRLPILMKRIAQGGVRLAMILNDVFTDDYEE